MRLPLTFIALIVLLTTAPLWAQQPEQPPPAQAPQPAQQPVQPPAQAPQPAQQPQQPSGPLGSSLRRIIPGRSLAGIALGSRISLVLSRFGRASEVRETDLDTVYLFNKFGLTVYGQKGSVTAVSTTNSLMKINDTLGPGSRVEEVSSTIGAEFREGTVEGFPGLIYDSRGVGFGLDRKAVAVVIVFRPTTAGSVSGLLPGKAVELPVTGFPVVVGLQQWSQETNFLSLPGYLRWVMYQAAATWITYTEAARVVLEQQSASR